MKNIRCAGLQFNGACPKQQQCANYAKWWQLDGVQFNACGDAKVLKHFIAVDAPPLVRRQVPQQELFA